MSGEFQSRTFRFGFPQGDDLESFKNDVDVLRDTDVSKLEGVVKRIQEIIFADTKEEENKISKEIIKSDLLRDSSTINSFYRIVRFFLKNFSDEDNKEDTPEIVIRDIAKKLNLEINELSTIKALLALVKKEVPEFKQKDLRQDYEKGLFPYFRGVGTTVELRGVFNRIMKFGESADSYAKEVEINKGKPAVPTISIAITLDSGNPKRFVFQSSPEKLEWLIEELKGALHKVKMLEEKLSS